MQKTFRRGIVLISGLSILTMTPAARADEFGGIESLTGADQTFTYGFEQEREVRRFEEAIIERDEAEEDLQRLEPNPSEVDEPRLKFSPSFRFSSLYDSNLFQSHSDPIDDVVFIYSPSLSARIGKPGKTRQFFRAFLNLSLVDFVENDNFSRANQTYAAEWGIRSEKWELRLLDKFKPVSSRESGERTELAGSNATRVVATSNAFSANLAYHLTPKADLTANYSHSIMYFPPSSNDGNVRLRSFSYQTNTITPAFVYKLSPKNTLTLGGYASIEDYYEDGSFSSRQYGLNASFWHRLTPKTDIRVNGGFDWRDYLLPVIPSSEGPFYGLIGRHQLTPKVSVTLSFAHRQHQEFDFVEFSSSLDSFDSETTDYRADLRWAMSQHMNMQAYFGVQYVERDGVFQIPDDEHPQTVHSGPLEDQVYRTGLEWTWRPPGPWSYFVSYEYLDKRSTFRALEFDEQRLGGYVRKAF